MCFNLNYEYISLVFAGLIYLSHCLTYISDTALNRVFRRMAGLNILTILINIAAIHDLVFTSGIHFFNAVFTAVYLSLQGWMAYTFSVYMDTLLQDSRRRNRLLHLRKVLILLYVIANIVNLITGTFYTADGKSYTKTIYYPLLVLIPFFMLLYVSVSALVHVKKLPQVIPSFIVLLTTFVCFEVQKNTHSQIIIMGTATTICMMVILFTLEAPERQKMLEALEIYHQDLEKSVREKTAQISIVQNGIINGLADLLSGRDPVTGSHARRCACIVQLITDKMRQEDLSLKKQKFFDDVVKAAPLHDIGDGTPLEELLNPESNMVRKILGNCSDDDFIQVTENIARYHRTRYDGVGAMDNNTGEFIPLEARIMAIAEAFDNYITKEQEEPVTVAMTMKRIWDEAGTLFDPALIKYVFACRDGLTAFYQEDGRAVYY